MPGWLMLGINLYATDATFDNLDFTVSLLFFSFDDSTSKLT